MATKPAKLPSMDDNLLAAENFKSLAETSLSNNLPGRAFLYYCLALEAKPEWSAELKTPITTCLCDWGKLLEHEKKYDDLFSYYEKALELYPDNEVILNNLGAHLCRLQQPSEALIYFKKALDINSNYLQAFVNVQVTKSILVERWHFRMLNDSIRNESYRRAIVKRVSRGCESVLDIGSGTGILSLFAKTAGAKRVYGCDQCETMVSISRKVLAANGLTDSITVINKLSTDLSIPEDIPERLSLVVTETFDAGLLGEHILETLIHAWENLLEPATGKCNKRVIPSGAVLYIVPIESMQIARKNFILQANRIDRTSFNIGLNLSQSCFSSEFDEPYDTENLKTITCSYLSHPEKLFEFNFNNVLDLKRIYNGEITRNIKFIFEKEGYLDAFAVWFELILDKEITITSSPFQTASCCWEQAIFSLKEERYYTKNSSIILTASCQNGILKLNSTASMPAECNKQKCFSPRIISVLNCESLLLTYVRSFEEIKKIYGAKNISVLDLSVFPYLGLLIAQKMNSRVFISNQNIELLNGSKELVRGFDSGCDIVVLDWLNILHMLKDKSQTFDIILADVLESTGQMSEEVVGMIPLLKTLLTPEGLFVPSKLEIWGQVVYSEEFVSSSEVRSSGDYLNIAKFINEYKVSQLIDFNLHDSKYDAMSEVFRMGSISLEKDNPEINIEKEIDITKSGQANAILHWYSVSYVDAVHFSTFSADSHINHAAALIEAPIIIEKESKIKIKLQYYTGNLRFTIEK